jgi:hypothetical protein
VKLDWSAQMIDINQRSRAIFGPVILYSEKQTVHGDWVIANLSIERFNEISALICIPLEK